MSGSVCECLGVSGSVRGESGSVRECLGVSGGLEELYFSNLTAHYNPIIFLIVLFRKLLNSSLEASRAIFYYLAPSMEPVG